MQMTQRQILPMRTCQCNSVNVRFAKWIRSPTPCSSYVFSRLMACTRRIHWRLERAYPTAVASLNSRVPPAALQPEPFEPGPQLDLAGARYISKTMLQILLSPPANAVSFVRG